MSFSNLLPKTPLDRQFQECFVVVFVVVVAQNRFPMFVRYNRLLLQMRASKSMVWFAKCLDRLIRKWCDNRFAPLFVVYCGSTN